MQSLVAALAAAGVTVAGSAARAQDADEIAQPAEIHDFSIAPQALGDALVRFGEQSGLQVSVHGDVVRGLSTPGVEGRLTSEAALARLLAGTGLDYRFSDRSTVTLRRRDADGAGLQLDSITVEASRVADPGQTEGSGSYASTVTSVASKIPASLRRTPQSVSVVTRQRIEDQNLTTLEEALAATNGASLQKSTETADRNNILVRGFSLDAVKVDGVNVSRANDVKSLFDLAIYDRVEVQRGPSGLFQGGTEPGGTADLVRKRAPADFEASGGLAVGSWQQRRAEADVGGPLVESGAIRGRLVGAYDSSESFVDYVEEDREVLFGTFDFDLGERTVLTLGGTWQNGDGRSARGLPAFADGRLLDVDRSTYIGAEWNDTELENRDVFLALDHRFDSGARLHASGVYLDRVGHYRYAYGDSPVDPETGEVELRMDDTRDSRQETSLDAYLTLPLDMLGREHTLLVGGDYNRSDLERESGRLSQGTLNVFDPDPSSIPDPDIPVDEFRRIDSEQFGLYGQARINPTSWGTVVAGGRLSWWSGESERDDPDGVERSSAEIGGEFTPYLAVIGDITEQLSLYGSWSSIFVPQEDTTASGEILDPRIGDQYEVGLNGEFMSGRLTTHAAVFRIVDKNRAIEDPDDPDYSIAAGKVKVDGFEAEITGEVLHNWQLFAGYTFMTSKFMDDAELEGEVFEPRIPKHSFKLWTKYTIGSGALKGLSLGGGLTAYSSFYDRDDGVRLQQDGYVVADAQVGYRLTDQVSLSATVTNLFDETYYERVEQPSRQNYYGAPRAFMLNLRARW